MDFIKAVKNSRVGIICSYLLVLIYFGIDRTIEYATDSYAALMMDDNWKVKIYDNGRVLQGALYYLIEQLHLSSGIKYQISYLSAFLFLGFSIFLLSRAINRYFENDILSVVTAFVTIVNPFFVEFFLFIEKGMFCFVILLNVYALYLTERIFRGDRDDSEGLLTGRNTGRSVLVLISLLISVLMYQTLIALYVVLCLAFIALNTKEFIKKNIYVACMYLIPMMIAFLLAKFVFPVERLSQRGSLSESFSAFFRSIKSVSTEKFSYLGGGSFSTWLMILAVIIVLFLVYERRDFMRHFLLITYETIGCIVMSFAIVFLNDSEISPRVVYTYASLFGIIIIYVIAELKKGERQDRLNYAIKVFSFALIGIICISEYTIFHKCFIERYRCNQADLYLCNIIGEKIKEYETATGNTVDTLCYYSDVARTWQDTGFEKTESSTRAQATGWSRTYSLNYYLGTDYTEGEPKSELTDYFGSLNWDTYSDEQLIFDGNTLHICIY